MSPDWTEKTEEREYSATKLPSWAIIPTILALILASWALILLLGFFLITLWDATISLINRIGA